MQFLIIIISFKILGIKFKFLRILEIQNKCFKANLIT
jgi:hypothetical protein